MDSEECLVLLLISVNVTGQPYEVRKILAPSVRIS
jgi:hypothetical protein